MQPVLTFCQVGHPAVPATMVAAQVEPQMAIGTEIRTLIALETVFGIWDRPGQSVPSTSHYLQTGGLITMSE
jgi:hypothetical protein